MRKTYQLYKNLAGVFLLSSLLAACAPTTTLPSASGTRLSSNTVSSASWFGKSDRGTVWRGIRSNMKMPAHTNRPEVQQQIAWYQAHKKHFNSVMSNSAPYIAYVFEETRKRKLPAELVLIPVIESEYSPTTRTSSSGASGLWQFMPRTASNYKLRMNRWYDGRYDVHASTHAALDYFTYLGGYFRNDWLLAMAGYNAGENGIARSAQRNIRAGKAPDFWEMAMPRETKRYVPKILALAAIIKDPGRYHMELPAIPAKPGVQAINVGKQIALKHAAKLAGMHPETLRKYNPGYRRGVTDPNGPHTLVVPSTHAETFKVQLAAAVQANQTLVSKNDFSDFNEKVSSKFAKGPKLKSRHKHKNHIHIVKRRETIFKIAHQYKIKANDIKRWNRLASNTKLKPGQKLVLYIPNA